MRSVPRSSRALEASDAREQLFDGGKPGQRSRDVKASSQAEAERSEVRELQGARDQMREQLDRMHYVNENLQDSSRTIGKTKGALEEYDGKLANAAKALGQLKRRTEEDSRYIWWSFYFFTSVVAYIVLRRLKVLKMIYYGVSLGAWSGQSVVDIVQSIYAQIKGENVVEELMAQAGQAA
mmetsp:Transcript_62633/g.149437  ORF Transcript_62633/g.149437 Transcript_62633/m.149437 type:complete len:180 (-) Transcript_62633:17-556(-)